MASPTRTEMIEAVRFYAERAQPRHTKALFAALREFEAGGWRPISEEEPPRQRNVLFWAVTGIDPPNWKMASGYLMVNYDGNLEWEWEGRTLKPYEVHPTHWMPLPSPPATSDGGEG